MPRRTSASAPSVAVEQRRQLRLASRPAATTRGRPARRPRPAVRCDGGRSNSRSSTAWTSVPRAAAGLARLGQSVDDPEPVEQRALLEVRSPAGRQRSDHDPQCMPGRRQRNYAVPGLWTTPGAAPCFPAVEVMPSAFAHRDHLDSADIDSAGPLSVLRVVAQVRREPPLGLGHASSPCAAA